MTCLDKLCCLGYSCIDKWVTNQQEDALENIVGSVKFVFDTSLSQLV